MTNEEFKQRNKRLLAREKAARVKGDFCSIVTRMVEEAKIPQDFLLPLRGGNLILEDDQGKAVFNVSLNSVRNVRFNRSGRSTLWLQLKFEIEDERYHLIFWNPASFRKWRIPAGNSLNLGMPFGTLIWWLRMARHLAPLRKANFAEAEKWRAVFPNAEFPDTQIKNAKS